MDKLLLALREEVEYPFSRTTLHATVNGMGFKYKMRNKKAGLYEQHRIIASRHQYLRQIVYLDETWLKAHHTMEICWIDYDRKYGLRVPSGVGGRLPSHWLRERLHGFRMQS